MSKALPSLPGLPQVGRFHLAAVASLSWYHGVKVRSLATHCCFAFGKGSTLTCRGDVALRADGGLGAVKCRE